MELIVDERRYVDACACAPAVAAFLKDLLGVRASRWLFFKAIVRPGHVSTMFLSDESDDALELWISATQQPDGQWTLRHSELPERSRAA